MYEFLWFLIGVVVCRIFSALVGYGGLYPFVREVYLLGVVFLTATVEDLLIIKKIKYELLEQSEKVDEQQLKLLQIVDDQMMESWKKASIDRFKSIWPKQLQGAIEHDTWNKAMNAISDRYKEEIWK
jgi:hypothetical protein